MQGGGDDSQTRGQNVNGMSRQERRKAERQQRKEAKRNKRRN